MTAFLPAGPGVFLSPDEQCTDDRDFTGSVYSYNHRFV
jgi:hypothetical protein